MAYQMAATIVTLNDIERYLSVAGLFKFKPLNICAAFYTISTDSVLARFLCISRASCAFNHCMSLNDTSTPSLTHSLKLAVIFKIFGVGGSLFSGASVRG